MPELALSTGSETKLNSIEEKLSELEDMQLLAKLDIISVKERIEKMSPPGASPELDEKIRILQDLAGNEKLQAVDSVMRKVESLEARMEGMGGRGTPAPANFEKLVDARIDERLAGMDKKISPAAKPDISALREELKAEIENLNKKVDDIRMAASPVQKYTDDQIDARMRESGTRFEDLENKMSAIKNDIFEARRDLEGRIAGIKTVNPDELDKKMADVENKISAIRNDALETKSELESRIAGIKTLNPDELDKKMADVEKLGVSLLKGDISSMVKEETGSVKADLEKRFSELKSANAQELKKNIDFAREASLRELDARMDEIRNMFSKTQNLVSSDDLQKYMATLFERVDKSDQGIEARVMAQLEKIKSELASSPKTNYDELVKFKLSMMDEINKRTEEIKKSMHSDMSSKMQVSEKEPSKAIDSLQRDVSDLMILRKDTENLRQLVGKVKLQNIEQIDQKIELLSKKQEWVESELLKKDLTVVMEKLAELDRRFREMAVSMPVFIE